MLSSIGGLIVNAILLTFILKLEKEKCECSKNSKRDYIKWFSVTMLVLALLSMITSMMKVKLPAKLMMVLMLVLFGATIYQAYALFTYSHELKGLGKGKECECSRDWRRDFMFYYSILYVFLMIMGVLFAINSMIMVSQLTPKQKKELMLLKKKLNKTKN